MLWTLLRELSDLLQSNMWPKQPIVVPNTRAKSSVSKAADKIILLVPRPQTPGHHESGAQYYGVDTSYLK